jgi:predicted negative regulator of RcsB-dependent stress response
MATDTVNGQGFESELNKTELGSFLSNNKGLIVALVVGVLVGVLGYGAYSSMKEKGEKNAANAFHAFETASLEKFKAGTLSADKIVEDFKAVSNEHASTNAQFSSALNSFDALFAKKDFKQANEVLAGITAKNNYQTFLLSLRKAAVLEETGDVDAAIAELNLINAANLKVMEGKVYLDLGRLYLKKGNKAEAKKNFEMVAKVKAQNIFKSLAQYYLQQL